MHLHIYTFKQLVVRWGWDSVTWNSSLKCVCFISSQWRLNIKPGKTEMLGEKSAPFTNCPSQTLHGQLSDWIQSSMVGSLSYGATCFLFFLETFIFLLLETHFWPLNVPKFGFVSFWKPVLAFWELLAVLTMEIYRNINLLMFLCI